MSYYNHQEAPVVYPPPPTSYPAETPGEVYPPPSPPIRPLPQSYPPPVHGHSQGPYVAAPPVAYPIKYGTEMNQQKPETKQKGDGFWKGCCAALCCCCLLDMCF